MPRISSELTFRDRLGTVKARWGIGRMRYVVAPGLYALGSPDSSSPIIITANYKLSFDHLRRFMPGQDAWAVVLDTKGINVWCAAGKGTFGTEELIRRIKSCGLTKLVSHRNLILPQLSAPGVAAHRVRKETGFTVIYGPILAKDLPAFLEAGCKASAEMRRKRFPIWERVVLIPVELVVALKWFALILPIVFLLGGLGGPHGYWMNTSSYGLWAVLAMLSALLSGAVMTPLLLPVLPGRAFAVKGLITGLMFGVLFLVVRWGWAVIDLSAFEAMAWLLLIPSVSSVLGMNFTGASTYTSLSGVKKEMRLAVPLQIGACIIGIAFWLTSRFTA